MIVMEPLRGGKLVNDLPKEAQRLWENALPKRSVAEWALRWVWDHPEVTVVLSGMSDEDQVAENIRTASDVQANAFTEKEWICLSGQKISYTRTSKSIVPHAAIACRVLRGWISPDVFRCTMKNMRWKANVPR